MALPHNRKVNNRISVIIPNYNGSATIDQCLNALFSSDYGEFEVVVVDDCSGDRSVEIIQRYPCRLIRLEKHSGAARARNRGAAESSGDILFFIDADCIVRADTLSVAYEAFQKYDAALIGGTYTRTAFDDTFFSSFQSMFINYFETKNSEPDYIASHAMLISKKLFMHSGGFPHEFLPIIEDVEFSHRLRRTGVRLVMYPGLLVGHIFNFTFAKSLLNAFKKSRYWTVYSMQNKDLLSDSGTASAELKINVVSNALIQSMMALSFFFQAFFCQALAAVVFVVNISFNRTFLKTFFKTKGPWFGVLAASYYLLIYPSAVIAGSVTGMMQYYLNSGRG